MIEPETCRAGRALLGWSQERLAAAARVGLGTIKNFEGERTSLLARNLIAIQSVLEAAGVEFIRGQDGGSGVMLRRFRLSAYYPNEGLNIELFYVDADLVEPDNDFVLWFRVSDSALSFLAGRPVIDEADARSVVVRNGMSIVAAAMRIIARDGLSSPGGKPRLIEESDLRLLGVDREVRHRLPTAGAETRFVK